MPTPKQIADKFAREWLEAKPTAITNYTSVASGLAQKAIDAKAKMIANFTSVMATSKYEDRLKPYVGTALMGNAYKDALDNIDSINDSQKLKIEGDVKLKRGTAASLPAVLTLYKDADAGEVTVPVGITDQGLNAMLIQGINANQYKLSATSTAQQIYTATSVYMNTVLGFPIKA